jgi:outer membrane lipoprotein-sorting protein
MKSALALSCGLLLFAAVPAWAEPSVDELVEKYQEARGGADAWKALKTARMNGNMTMGPMEAPFRLEFARDNKVRMEFDLQGMTAIQAYDGKVGWAVMPFLGKLDPEPMAEDQLKTIKDMADMDGPLVDYKAKGHKVEMAGAEPIEGTDAYKLQITKANGDEETWWLDAEYYLPIKTASKIEQMGQTMEVSTTLGDYKEVDGLIFPFSISSSTPMGAQTITIETIETSPALPADRFSMPAAAPAAPAAASEG